MPALLLVCRLHFQQAQPVAGERRRDFGHPSAGGRPDERHDAEVIDVLGNDIAEIHFAAGFVTSRLLQSPGMSSKLPSCRQR